VKPVTSLSYIIKTFMRSSATTASSLTPRDSHFDDVFDEFSESPGQLSIIKEESVPNVF
jgi:hypothetical protein